MKRCSEKFCFKIFFVFAATGTSPNGVIFVRGNLAVVVGLKYLPLPTKPLWHFTFLAVIELKAILREGFPPLLVVLVLIEFEKRIINLYKCNIDIMLIAVFCELMK